MTIQTCQENLINNISILKRQLKQCEESIELAYRYWSMANLRLEMFVDSGSGDPNRQRFLLLRVSSLEEEIKAHRQLQRNILENLSAYQLDLDLL